MKVAIFPCAFLRNGIKIEKQKTGALKLTFIIRDGVDETSTSGKSVFV